MSTETTTVRPYGERVPFCAIDFEASTPDPMTAVPLAVGVIITEPDEHVSYRYASLIQPPDALTSLDETVTRLTGLTLERCRTEGVPADLVFAKLHEIATTAYLANCAFVAFNARYDWPLWHRTSAAHGSELPPQIAHAAPLIDPHLLDFRARGDTRLKRSLAATCDRWRVPLPANPHDALSDALAAARLARRLLRDDLLMWLDDASLRPAQTSWFSVYMRDVLNDYLARKGSDRRVSGEWPWGAMDPPPNPRPVRLTAPPSSATPPPERAPAPANPTTALKPLDLFTPPT